MSTHDIPGSTNFAVSKLYDGIDYDFRPETFWETTPDPLAAILRNGERAACRRCSCCIPGTRRG